MKLLVAEDRPRFAAPARLLGAGQVRDAAAAAVGAAAAAHARIAGQEIA